MIKFLNGRKDIEAMRYWNLAGAGLPPEAAPFTYTYTKQAVVIHGTLELKKGQNSLSLPTPSLSENALLLVSLAPELQEAEKAVLNGFIFARDLLGVSDIRLTITAKEAGTYEGSLAHYYLLSDR